MNGLFVISDQLAIVDVLPPPPTVLPPDELLLISSDAVIILSVELDCEYNLRNDALHFSERPSSFPDNIKNNSFS